MAAVGVADVAADFLGRGKVYTYVAFGGAALGGLSALLYLWLSRKIDEEGHFRHGN
jgi:hypothetical protein